MKLLPLASLTLITSLSLTGCATTPTLEDQTKLVEYEKCLNFASDALQASRARIQELAVNASVEEKLKLAIIAEEDFNQIFEENLLDRCLLYRP